IKAGPAAGVPRVVRDVAVVVVDAPVAELTVDRSPEHHLALLLAEEAADLHVLGDEKAEVQGVRERVLGLDAVVEEPVPGPYGIAGDSVAHGPARGAADLDPRVLGPRRRGRESHD